MKKPLSVLILLGLSSSVLSACSLDASISMMSEIAAPFVAAKTSGLTSGSSQTGTATGGYYVQSTVGNYMNGIEQGTVEGDYKVYSSVQGALVSQ